MRGLLATVRQPQSKRTEPEHRVHNVQAKHGASGNSYNPHGAHDNQLSRKEQKVLHKPRPAENGLGDPRVYHLDLDADSKREEEDEAIRQKGSTPLVLRHEADTAIFGALEHSGRALAFDRVLDTLDSIDESRLGETVFFRARIHGTRRLSAKLAFIIFRDGITTVQGVVRAGAGAGAAVADHHIDSAEMTHSNTAATCTHVDGTLSSVNGSATWMNSVDGAKDSGTASGETVIHPTSQEMMPNGNGQVGGLASRHNGTKFWPSIPPSSDNTGSPAIVLTPREDLVQSANPDGQEQQRNAASTASAPSSLNPLHASPNHHVSEETKKSTPHLPETTAEEGVTEEMVRWVEKLPLETLVLVQGVVRRPEDNSDGKQKEVKSTEVAKAEIEVTKLLVVSQVTSKIPFAVSHATIEGRAHKNGNSARVGFHSLLEHRALSLRSPAFHAIFRLVSACSRAAREYLDENDFTEIHSSKFQQGASEGGAGVFVVDYFGRKVTLAQSPQLAKEICIGADFGKVYEIGPVFRAEHSNTHRHLCEFTGLDLEMAIHLDYHEAMHVIDELLKHIFRTVLRKNRAEIDVVKSHFPHEDLVFPDETIVLTFSEGVKLLRESGYKEEGEPDNVSIKELPEFEDLSTRAEVRLGELVKEKYKTDYYILDKFPLAARPFYTMPDSDNPKYSNAFDIYLRGEEILSGSQRLHHALALDKALDTAGIPRDSIREYLEAFQFAMPPHAGGGIGLERLVMLFFGLGNIRHATLLPRDPRSFLSNPRFDGAGASAGPVARLPVPKGVVNFHEPNVLSKDRMFKEGKHPSLETLIARFGGSTNTAWTDRGYEIWRHPPTGFAIGFVDAKGHAVTWGAPLCPPDRVGEVIRGYIDWCRQDRKLGLIWANADDKTEQVLVNEHHWKALAVTSEQRLDPSAVLNVESKHLDKKVRQARAAGVTINIIKGEVTEDLRLEIDAGIQKWLEGRKGTQIHTTSLRPWAIVEHRTYFVARDKEQKACGMIVLQQLAPEHGFQIKWCLMFPGAPSGTSEMLVTTAMKTLSEAGVRTATFGAGAKDTFEAVSGIGNTRGKVLAQMYKGISKAFGLTRKSHFRKQFGSIEDSLYICYPSHGLGFRGISAIMESVKAH